MKKKFAIGGVFLITYLVFLIATLPAIVLLNQVTLPKEVHISGVSGSVWRTNIEQVIIGESKIQQVKSTLNIWSLLSLSPSVNLTFGDAFVAGPEGQFELVFSQEKAKIRNLKLLIKANEIAQQLPLPLPMTAQGDVELVVDNAEIDLNNQNQCIAISGKVTWTKSGVLALEKNIKLGNLTADLGCENGALAVVIAPNNDLGLTFSAYVRAGGKISGNGFLAPGASFPKALNDVLPFLGRKDNQGRYRLSF